MGTGNVLLIVKVKQNEPKERDPSSALSLCQQQLGAAGAPMQPGQVAPNQNFLNRPPGPIPVSHGNVQQQVRTLTCCAVCARCLLTPPGLVHACFIDSTQRQCGSSLLLLLPPPHTCTSSLVCPVSCSLWWWACPPLVRSL